MRFAARPAWPRRLVPNGLVRRHLGAAPGVLLTFDDGPHPEHTPAVLDRLREYGTSAVFFVVGHRVTRAPEVLGRVRDAGHQLGNHTFSHRPDWLALRSAWRDVARCQRLVAEATEAEPMWFRPPLGRPTPGLLAAAWGHGLRVLNWSLDSGDWRCRSAADADRCTAEVAELVRPGDVLLFHDDHPYIGRILDGVLPGLAERGLLRAAGLAPAVREPIAATARRG